jgi:hypothetical protein
VFKIILHFYEYYAAPRFSIQFACTLVNSEILKAKEINHVFMYKCSRGTYVDSMY